MLPPDVTACVGMPDAAELMPLRAVQILLVLTLLLRLLGWLPTLAGFLLLLCLLPLAAKVNVLLADSQVRLLDFSDARVKLISEVAATCALHVQPAVQPPSVSQYRRATGCSDASSELSVD